MHIYFVENLKLYEPSMLAQEEEHVLSPVENLAPNAQEELIAPRGTLAPNIGVDLKRKCLTFNI